MTEQNQPTLEELQSQLLALQEKQEQQEQQIEALNSEKDKLSADLNKARELNTKLFLRVPMNSDNTQSEQPQEEDSFDKLLDEVFEKYVIKKSN